PPPTSTLFPYTTLFRSFLLELPAPDNGKAFLFPSLAGKGTGGKSGLSMAFTRIMEKARVRGEVVRERQGEKGRSVNSLSFHSFRDRKSTRLNSSHLGIS